MPYWTGTPILAVFVLVALLALPVAWVKSRRHRKESRAWLRAENRGGPETPDETTAVDADEPRTH